MSHAYDSPIHMVDRATAKRRVTALLLRRPAKRLAGQEDLLRLRRMRITMVNSWARAVYQASGLPMWREVDVALGQPEGSLVKQARRGCGKPWPTCAVQSRACDEWGVSPIGVEPTEEDLR